MLVDEQDGLPIVIVWHLAQPPDSSYHHAETIVSQSRSFTVSKPQRKTNSWTFITDAWPIVYVIWHAAPFKDG
jgi:hypothetical protein